MILAAFDYWTYCTARGRYSFHANQGRMSSAWDGGFPEQLVRLLKPGDVILLRGGNWVGSWLVMYMTSSWVSHVATYVGNGEVIHATNMGVVVEPLHALASNERDGVLPFVLPLTDEERAAMVDAQRALLAWLLSRHF